MLRITLAQINPTIGAVAANVALMREAARQAHAAGADLVVFPELALTAYHPADLLGDVDFLRRVAAGLQELLAASRELPELHWAVGLPTERSGPGKPLHNSLLVLRAGQVALTCHKQLLPTYDVFDERRHFEPGPDAAHVLAIAGVRVGFLICEDAWNDGGADYAVNPLQRLAAAAPELVVSINASPSHRGKREQRHAVFGAACRRHGLPLVYVNQIGGHDQLVYDGASFAVDGAGRVVFEARRFGTDAPTLAFDAPTRGFLDAAGRPLPPPGPGLSAMAFYRAQTVLGLVDYARRCNFARVLVGSSGGIDSALTLALAAEALGPAQVEAVTMPSRFSSSGSVTDSERLCAALGVALHRLPIEGMVHSFEQACAPAFGRPLAGVPLENLQARVRGTALMAWSNTFGHLLLTTGNKSEISVGYCTLYGDTNGGLGLIGDLYKTEVFALARHLNAQAGEALIPETILDKPPSAELAPDQRDSDSLPPYPLLDAILQLHIEGDRLPADEAAAARAVVAPLSASADGQALVRRVHAMVARNEYKRRQAPPILRLRPRAFGSGRQLPIAAQID